MEEKKRILFISTQLPYPPESGGKMKSWHYLLALVNRYQLSLACFLKDETEEEAAAEFQNHIQLYDFYGEKLHINRNPLSLIKSYFGHACLNVYRNYSSTFKQKISKIANTYDLLLIDHYEMFQYVPKDFKGKVVMHTHNAEFMLWQRMGELTKNPLVKWLLKAEAKRVKKYEKAIFKASNLIYSTPSDIELYKTHAFKTDKHRSTYHLGNDQLLELPPLKFSDTELALSFMGTLSWEPNIDALLWFIQEVWPQIIKKQADCRFYIMGKKGDERIYEAAKKFPNIIFTGFVKDLESYLKKSRVYIAPLRFGSGMKVKVLEGLYRGVPMVSTSVGAEGLAVKNEQDILIADDNISFANSCITLLENKNRWETVRDNSRKIAKEKYRWKPLFEKMDLSLKALFK